MKNKITIGIDASRSIDMLQKTGVEVVSDNLVSSIQNQSVKDNNLNIIYYTPKKISWLPKENQRILNWPFKYLWTQIRLAWELLIHPPDKFFVPVHKIPFLILLLSFRLKPESRMQRKTPGSRIKSGMTNKIELYILIHDIAFIKTPKLYPRARRWYLNYDLKRCLKKCTKIFVPTQAVKNDLLKHTTVKENKIIVIHHGYRPFCHSELVSESPEILNQVQDDRFRVNKSKTGVKKKQILYIGRLEKKKNIRNLIKAFEIFYSNHKDYELILAGPIQMKLEKIPHVKYTGYVTGEQKHNLLQESNCLVLVSHEEGFGFPILEAWDYNLPVLTSNIPVLREVGGNACLYTDPDSPENIAQKLETLTFDEHTRAKLKEWGSERLKNFSWPTAAQKYLQEILQ